MRRLREIFFKKPFFWALTLLLLIISVVSLRPEHSLLGWDNYSSYFNTTTNWWRTVFHTWREHRGLGVPSDSEVADIVRSGFFLIFSNILSTNLLDQVYFLFSFCLGALSVYFLFSKILSNNERFQKYRDVGGFVAAFFYIFNLHTLSIFYFPITPYITRFFAIPLLFLVFYSLNDSNFKLTLKKYLLVLFAVFISAPSFVIGTVFVTLGLALLIFSFFQIDIKKALLVLTVFVLLQSFWTLPFANYTLEKSGIIRLAPTFISANETQLNKPKSYYAFSKQLILIPSFFQTNVSNLDSTETSPLHPQAHVYENPYSYPALFIFPILYILGSVLILFRIKKNTRILWVPVILIIYFFLSLKEFSPFGFLYRLLSQSIPYFEVIFRFGDTKFHPYIAFCGALAASYAVVYIISELQGRLKSKVMHIAAWTILIFCIPTLIQFHTYFTGGFIGFFMYNRVPSAYREMAILINNDPADFRVLHLPYDDNVYWRSYSWGYVGSSFFHFMIDKPIFEKTFEPGSMENAYVMERVQKLLHNSQSLDANNLSKRSEELYKFLKMLGVKYVILDETVSASQPSRGITLWGKFNYPEAQKLLEALEKNGQVAPVYNGEVNVAGYMNEYDKLLAVSHDMYNAINTQAPQQIVLYELKNPEPKVTFIEQATQLDPTLTGELLVSDMIGEDHTLQGSGAENVVYPFLKRDLNLTKSGNKINIELAPSNAPSIISFKTTNKPTTYLIEITGKIQENYVILTSYLHYLPTINNKEYKEKLDEITIPLKDVEGALSTNYDPGIFLADWSPEGRSRITDLRVRVGKTIIPVSTLSQKETSQGYVIVDQNTFDFAVLKKSIATEVLTSAIKLTESPNCYGDKLEGYEYKLGVDRSKFQLSGKNGSTCFWQDFSSVSNASSDHVEIELNLKGKSTNLDMDNEKSVGFTSKPRLTEYVKLLEKPNTLEVCIKEKNIDECYNSHKLLQIPRTDSTIRIPADKNTFGKDNLYAFFALKNIQYQKQDIEISRFAVYGYAEVEKQTTSFEMVRSINQKLDLKDTTIISLPHVLSPGSYNFNSKSDMFYVANKPCEKEAGYRTYRVLSGKIISYVEDCQNAIFPTLDFSSSAFYLWSVNYNLASGQYPSFVLADGFYQYINEYTSLYQGYPDIDGFKSFQYPELPFSSYEDRIGSLEYKNSYTFVYPSEGYEDMKPKDYKLEQYSENEGIVLFENMSVTELPNYWKDITISTKGQELATYSLAQVTGYESILPSMKKINIQTKGGENAKYLLKFNEGYDRQWGIYNSPFSAIFGRSIPAIHSRCDGYANCFEISGDTLLENKELYIYYWPETLALLGWIITIIMLPVGYLILISYSRTKK